MNQNKLNWLTLVIGGIAGVIITVVVTQLSSSVGSNQMADMAEDKNAPLYWVAPMDANFKRDKPGLSPMGMDLIPIYEDKGASDGANDEGPGAIRISPTVINNLGVRTAQAQLKPLNLKIKTVGYVGYNEDKLLHIHPRVEGWVEKLHVKAAGDPVKKGQPLYDIYSPALVNAQEELVLALGRKNKRLVQAAEDRLKALHFPHEAISELQKSRKVKQTVSFYAPQTGVVDNLNIRQGFFVKPGTMLMSVGALDEVWVEAEVFERQAALVTKGAAVSMTLDFLPGKEWSGKVDYVYPTLDAVTRTVKVRLRFNNPDRQLKPNMFAQVTIHGNNHKNTLLVPKESVIRSGTRDRVVLALGGGRFKSIEVKVGAYDDNNAEILSGLNLGELVVTSAQFLLDSESSKTSDFKRLSGNMTNTASNNSTSTAITLGTINEISLSKKTLNISRQAIEKWNRPAATLDFNVADQIDFSALQKGQQIHFRFKVEAGEFTLIELMSDGEGFHD